MTDALYSCFGTTDPVRGVRDGGLMHILRFYRPRRVYLFLSREISALDARDHRIDKLFAFLKAHWDGYAPEYFCCHSEISDPSDIDALMVPMGELFSRVMAENPGGQILINLSSGTPQMQILLAQMALDSRYRTRGIQVKNPERAAGTESRTHGKDFQVEDALEMNLDEEPTPPNRCCEPKMLAVRRETVRNQLEKLLPQRNYAAIAQMGADLPAPIPQLARHLDCRSRFLLQEAERLSQGLSGLGIPFGRGPYPQPVYEMIEYFAMLKQQVYLKRYTEFLLRLNPFLVRLQSQLLRRALPQGLGENDLLLVENKRKYLSPERIAANAPQLLTYLEGQLGEAVEQRHVSIRVMNLVLAYFQVDEGILTVLSDCEKCNQRLRNAAAHDLFSISGADIQTICGATAETLLHRLEEILTATLSDYHDPQLTKRLNVYDFCDRVIRQRAGG